MGLKVPKYHELPIKPDAPPSSSWGVFDKENKRDTHGTLNFITPEAVVAAREEIQTGDLPLTLPHVPCPGRIKLEHRLITAEMHNLFGCDDEVILNTQASSQWDGLMHYAHQERKEFYNGVKFADACISRTDKTLGIQALSERGGIVARGVLVDFVRYAKQKGIEYDPLSNYAISLVQIQEILQEEGVAVKQGDVLVIRTGLSKWIKESTPESIGPWERDQYIGVDPTREFLEWVWNNNIAALASDAISVEAIPASDNTRLRLHEACIAGWGMMLGELLDLEALAKVAEREKRWTFFLTVSPLNLEGGAATIANTLAVF
ncbi:hypothetical protein CLAIMM_00125 [Cladophialophora immunda]|nr:hypothetical protein CLAIMM_00125 [Cladophialophora immunda]